MNKEQQLADLDVAYEAFFQIARALSPQAFLASLGDWTPRDILAHFIGWNRITLVGCSELQEGVQPFYFYDGTNDYRRVNAKFIARFASTDREELLREMATTKDVLRSYLKSVDEKEWDHDTGVEHYRGGPATVSRCVDSLIRDYRKHREEIVQGTRALG
jgi:hypothetical protein